MSCNNHSMLTGNTSCHIPFANFDGSPPFASERTFRVGQTILYIGAWKGSENDIFLREFINCSKMICYAWFSQLHMLPFISDFWFWAFQKMSWWTTKGFPFATYGHPRPQTYCNTIFELFCHVLKIIELPPCIPNKSLFLSPELNKNRRKLFRPRIHSTSFLEGGASGASPVQYHSDIASVSGRWYGTLQAYALQLSEAGCRRSVNGLHCTPSSAFWVSGIGLKHLIHAWTLCQEGRKKEKMFLCHHYQMPHTDYFFFLMATGQNLQYGGRALYPLFYLPI